MAERPGGRHLRLHSIPFCAYGLAYGDVVKLDETQTYLDSVVAASGNRVHRVLLTPALSDDEASEIVHGLLAAAGTHSIPFERHGPRFIAFSVEPAGEFAEVLRLSEAGSAQQHLFGEWAEAQAFRGPTSRDSRDARTPASMSRSARR